MKSRNLNIDLSVIVPTLNSSTFIEQTLQTLSHTLKINKLQSEIIIVDDFSLDNTISVILNFVKQNQGLNIKLIQNNKSSGQVISTMNGIRESKGKYLLLFDDDLQYDVSDIKHLIENLTNNPEFVMINGFKSSHNKKKFFYKLILFLFTRLTLLFFPSFINKHYFTSFKIFKRELFFENDKYNKKNIYYFWSFPANKISFIQINQLKGIRNKSNYNKWKILSNFQFLIVKLLQRILLVIILLLASYVLFKFIKYKIFYKFILSCFLILFFLYFLTIIWLKKINYQIIKGKYKLIF